MRKMLFHHIPKTAGTSLVAHASVLFRDCVFNGRYDEQVSDDAIVNPQYTFYHGHFTRAFVQRFRQLVPDAIIFTLVRHPFNRTLSQYYNWTDKKRVEHELDAIAAVLGETKTVQHLRAKFRQKIFGMSLDEFLRSDDPDILQATDNLQAQYMTLPGKKVRQVRFHAATMNAVSFYDFVGIQELYEPCLRILEMKCNLPVGSLGGNSRENVSDEHKADGHYQISSRELQLLENRNIYDLALYHACYALLLKEYAEWLPQSAASIDLIVQLPRIHESTKQYSLWFLPRSTRRRSRL